jgi:hypothetical protein
MGLRSFSTTLAMGSGASVSGTIPLRGSSSGHIVMPDAFSGTLLNFMTSADGQTYRPLSDASGPISLATSVSGSRSYPLPTSLFGAHSFYLSAGTIQSAARSFAVFMRGTD